MQIDIFFDGIKVADLEIDDYTDIKSIKKVIEPLLNSLHNIDRNNINLLVETDNKSLGFPLMNVTDYDDSSISLYLHRNDVDKSKVNNIKITIPQKTAEQLHQEIDENEKRYGNLLTHIKDVNFEIMNKMDDQTLLNFCKVNHKAARLCRDENFWRKRFVNRFMMNEDMNIINNYVNSYLLPKYKTWKDIYLLAIHDIYKNELEIFEYIKIPINDEEPLIYDIDEADVQLDNIEDFLSFLSEDNEINRSVEKLKNMYLFTNLGERITIKFPITGNTYIFDDTESFYDEEFLEDNQYTKVYSSPHGITVPDVVRYIMEFYQKKISKEELDLIPRELRDTPNIRWKDVLIFEEPLINFYGLEKIGENVYRLMLGR